MKPQRNKNSYTDLARATLMFAVSNIYYHESQTPSGVERCQVKIVYQFLRFWSTFSVKKQNSLEVYVHLSLKNQYG